MAEKYLWVDQIAQKWGVSKSWVYRLCRQGRVTGAFFYDGRWSVPEDAVKPQPVPSKRIKKLQSRKIELPASLPLRFSGDGESVPTVTERLFEGCAEYVIDFVDLAPGNGKTLFCALSYPHIRAIAFCENALEYAFLSTLKAEPSELYSKLSMMLFEFFACQPNERREYYRSVKASFSGALDDGDMLSLSARALFLCHTSSGGELSFSDDGSVSCEMKRRLVADEPLSADFMCLSELLSRAEIYPDHEMLADASGIPEYSAVHISPEQYEQGAFSHITRACERVLVL
jgi:hypothetical protein